MDHFVSADIAEVTEQVGHDALVMHANAVFMKFLSTLDDDDIDKIEYLRFVSEAGEETSEDSFDSWCSISGREELKVVYAQFASKEDNAAKIPLITFDMMKVRIEQYHPSSSSSLEKEYAQKYQDFLPEKERRQTRIGF